MAVMMTVQGDVAPFGVCAHLDNPGARRGANVSWHRATEVAQMMYRAGVRSVRTDLAWAACEKSKGVWDFTRTDKAINTCVENGLEPVPVLAYSVRWAAPAHEHPEEWRGYVRQVVQRYKKHVKVWEVWNEENCGFWKPHPDPHEYGKFLKLTYETIKECDPTARVALGGTTGVDFKFIGVLQQEGMNRYYDICCVHPYFDPFDPEGRVDMWLPKLRAQMDAAGDKDKPIWITEVGMPTAPNPSARNTGNIAAALQAVGRADKPLRVLYWHGGNDDKKLREDDPFLYMYKRDFPAGSVFDVVGLESFPAALATNKYDAVVIERKEYYPAAAQEQLLKFVREGGVLLCIGGAALWYPATMPGDTRKYNSWVLRNALRFEMDAWFLNERIPRCVDEEYPSKPTQALWKFRPNEQTCMRFFRPSGLKEGDEWIPLLRADMGNGYTADGVVAIKYGSDMKGALILSGVWERQGCRVCSPQRQAEVLARAYLLSFACGVERVYWYEFMAHEYDASDCEEHFGIVHRDLTPKPAYEALYALTRLGIEVDKVKFVKGAEGVYHVVWTLPDGRVTGALWSISNQMVITKDAAHFLDMFGRKLEVKDGVLHLSSQPIYYRANSILSFNNNQ